MVPKEKGVKLEQRGVQGMEQAVIVWVISILL